MLNNYTEEWKPIPGFFGLYEASTYGRIRNTRGKILKTYKINSGYHCLKFTVNNVRTTHLVHRLVAITFLPHAISSIKFLGSPSLYERSTPILHILISSLISFLKPRNILMSI